VKGERRVTLTGYIDALLASGFPGLQGLSPRAIRAQLDGYLLRISERELVDQGVRVRRPEALRGWLTAYAAATATATKASYTTLLDAASSGEGGKPARGTIDAYRSALTDLSLLDRLPGYLPTRNPLRRASLAPPGWDCGHPRNAARPPTAQPLTPHQPSVPGPPLKGPATRAVTQLP
jgi:hypothetical protein